MASPIFLSTDAPIQIKTEKYELSGLVGRVISLNHHRYDGSNDRYKVIAETPTTISVQRLQQDTFNPNKYYLTDEINKFHDRIGIDDGPPSKGRKITVYLTL